jgi:flagellar assembly protein FliH
MSNNVNSSAQIISTNNVDEQYKLGEFLGNSDTNQIDNANIILSDRDINGNVDPLMKEIKKLTDTINQIQIQVADISNDGIKGRDLDKQLVEAMKYLKNYATFFEQAIFQMETKILKTSISIAKKVIGIEVGENSEKIAKETIASILDKIKTSSKITIHLNPKDYVVLKSELNLEPFILLQEDANVIAGGVVIASDLGNFDGNIEAKVETLLESLNSIT